MKLLLDSFWRAAAYCLHPRVIALSLLPLVLMVAIALGLGYFYWDNAIDSVRAAFESWSIYVTLAGWLVSIGLPGLQSALAPLVVVFLVTPLIVVGSLLAVAVLMSPSILSLVAERRFSTLEKKRGGSFFASAFLSLGATLIALLALLVSIPFWFIPPLVLILPPLIWGWLTYRVLSYDMLAEHASVDERQTLLRRHRASLLGIGVLTGYLGAAPSVVWASGVLLFVAMAPVLVPVAIWIYTLVFAFSALWFAHYLLAALEALRGERPGAIPPAPPQFEPAPDASELVLLPPAPRASLE